jgi:hypothetical protein
MRLFTEQVARGAEAMLIAALRCATFRLQFPRRRAV